MRRIQVLVLTVALVLAGCGGGDPGTAGQPGSNGDGGGESAPAEQTGVGNGETGSGNGQSGAAGGEAQGDPAAFRFTGGGFENACTVLDPDEVAAATGFTVLSSQEAGGCFWFVEPGDEEAIGEATIGWAPVTHLQYKAQREASERGIISGVVVDPISDIGDSAYWAGNEVNELGEVWVEGHPIAFHVINQFATFHYTDDSRAPMEALARALSDALAEIDVMANSGEYAKHLLRPEKIEVPAGLPMGDALLPELAAFPLPDGPTAFSPGFQGDRVEQNVYLEMSMGDVTRFLLAELPKAGFEITNSGVTVPEDVLEYNINNLSFETPDGKTGNIYISPGSMSPTTVLIQLSG